MVEGNELVQQAICIGAKYGKISAAKLFPSKFTVKRLPRDEAIEVKTYLAQAVNNAIKENGIIGMTLDMWSDIKQRNYLGIIVYLISKEKLISATLSMHEFPHQVESADNFRSSVLQTCESLGISQPVLCNQLYFVTDQGSYVRAALSTFHRIPCACHVIATGWIRFDAADSMPPTRCQNIDIYSGIRLINPRLINPAAYYIQFAWNGIVPILSRYKNFG